MDIKIEKIPYENASVLRNMMELYNYDFSEFEDADLNEHGLYGYEYIDNYWNEAGRHPFFVRVDGKLAGFALVRDSSNTGDCSHIAEFFVLRKYRCKGVGRIMAHRIFDMFPGEWLVSQTKRNLPAQTFWRTVISEYTGGRFEEITKENGPAQTFETS